MAIGLGPHQREKDIVVLLALELVNSCDLVRQTNERIVGTSLLGNIPNEMLLPIVGGENSDTLSRIANQSHIHISANNEFGFGQILVEVSDRLGFAVAIKVGDVDQLI